MELVDSNKSLGVYLTPKDLENELGINYNTQYKLRKDKAIPYTKVGGKIMYDKYKILKWLQNNSCEGVKKD